MKEHRLTVAYARSLTAAYGDSRAFRCAPPRYPRRVAAHARNFPARYYDRAAIDGRRACWPMPWSMSN